MLIRIAIAAFLVAHGAIHAGFITSPPTQAGGPAWPFRLDQSWLLHGAGVDGGVARLIGLGLVAATIGGLALAGVASLGILPGSLWPIAATIGTVASLALLLLFFHPWLVVGVAIDLVLLWAVLIAGWAPEGLGT
jgi:hypothetical protein